MIRDVKITEIEELLFQLNSLPNNYVYRGQANADWDLESSLERVISEKWDKEVAKRAEDFSLIQFQSKFHLYDNENVPPNTKLAWLAIMQHYGVPTRLVDFTESPYVALYFALESYNPKFEQDFSIFAFDYSAIMDCSLQEISRNDSQFKETRLSLHSKRDIIFEKIVDAFSYDILWITEPEVMNMRLDRQSGSFLLSGNGGAKIQKIINLPIYSNVNMLKFSIDYSLYESVYALLRKMNVTSKSLYGNLDGLAKHIRMELVVRSV